ncbi:MAG: iron ABC transporter permease [Bacteroidetes bacterium]|nr:iron ABC transporter permease [Bacteroidota bacterium]
MNNLKSHSIYFVLLSVGLLMLLWINIFSGQISISSSDLISSILSFDENNTIHILIREFRIPRMFMSLLAGSSLAVCGLLLQTLLNNPLAGPYVLGINSGASLFVALTLLTGISFFSSDLGIISAGILGSLFIGIIILLCSFSVKTNISLLLIGLMISSFISALISVLQSSSSADQLKRFVIWSMGSLQQVSFAQLPLITVSILFSLLSVLLVIKPLNALVLGEVSAKNLGVNIKKVRLLIIIITAILAGIITAFCGPIAFIGLAIPNISRIIFKTQNHLILVSGNLLLGGVFLVLSDCIIQWIEPWYIIPINAFTSILGAPFVIYLLFKKIV